MEHDPNTQKVIKDQLSWQNVWILGGKSLFQTTKQHHLTIKCSFVAWKWGLPPKLHVVFCQNQQHSFFYILCVWILRMLVVPLLFHSFWASKFWDGWIFQQDHVLPSCLTHWASQQNTAFCHLGLWFNNTGNSYSMVSPRSVSTLCFTRSFATADIQNKTTTTLVDWSRHVPKAAAHWRLPSRLYAPKLVYSFF